MTPSLVVRLLHAPNKQEFLNAEMDEINGLVKMNVWKYQQISSLSKSAHIINSTWSNCCKWTVNGHLSMIPYSNTKHGDVPMDNNNSMHGFLKVICPGNYVVNSSTCSSFVYFAQFALLSSQLYTGI